MALGPPIVLPSLGFTGDAEGYWAYTDLMGSKEKATQISTPVKTTATVRYLLTKLVSSPDPANVVKPEHKTAKTRTRGKRAGLAVHGFNFPVAATVSKNQSCGSGTQLIKPGLDRRSYCFCAFMKATKAFA